MVLRGAIVRLSRNASILEHRSMDDGSLTAKFLAPSELSLAGTHAECAPGTRSSSHNIRMAGNSTNLDVLQSAGPLLWGVR
jgi:hypothetical protein